MAKKKQPKPRVYRVPAAEVIKVQRRVLRMVLNTIGRMSNSELLTLRACGKGGVVTLNEVSAHIVAALQLQAKEPTR